MFRVYMRFLYKLYCSMLLLFTTAHYYYYLLLLLTTHRYIFVLYITNIARYYYCLLLLLTTHRWRRLTTGRTFHVRSLNTTKVCVANVLLMCF
jgi:hypothetical protein